MKTQSLSNLRSHRARSVAFLAFVIVFSSSPRLWSQQNPSPTSDPKTTSESIRISPGDTVDIRVAGTTEFSGTLRVSGDGTVKINWVGDVPIVGLTESEAAQRINDALIRHHQVLTPQTTVFIPAFSARGVTIMGEVVHPGVYPLSSSRSLLDIVAEAGGLTPQADTRVSIKRSNGSVLDTLISLPADNGRKSLEDDVPVGVGDRIMIERASLIYVLGDVAKPGGYMMLVNGRITVLQAIAAAGGPSRTAGENNAVLIKSAPDGAAGYPLALKDILRGKKQDFALSPGDVIYVPTSNLKNFVVNAPQILGTLAGAAIYAVSVR